jgi:alpha-tubulin suppressor-like RCC1 family protein
MMSAATGAGNVSLTATYTCYTTGTTGNNVQCRGLQTSGQLGNPAVYRAASATAPIAALAVNTTVPTGGAISKIVTAANSACAIRAADGKVLCWGDGTRLLYGTTLDIGVALSPAAAGPLPLGNYEALDIAMTGSQTVCGVLRNASGTVLRCWGKCVAGSCGLGTVIATAAVGSVLGDNETILSVPAIALTSDRVPSSVSCGGGHCCVLTTTGHVQCWGDNSFAQTGLTIASVGTAVGDNEHVSAAGPVAGIPTATKLAVGYQHTCILGAAGAVWCWGICTNAECGQGSLSSPRTPVSVPLGSGRTAVDIIAAAQLTCALLADATASVLCWGRQAPALYGDNANAIWGDSEAVSTLPLLFNTTTKRVTAMTASSTTSTSVPYVCFLVGSGAAGRWVCTGVNTNRHLPYAHNEKVMVGIGSRAWTPTDSIRSWPTGDPVGTLVAGAAMSCALIRNSEREKGKGGRGGGREGPPVPVLLPCTRGVHTCERVEGGSLRPAAWV